MSTTTLRDAAGRNLEGTSLTVRTRWNAFVAIALAIGIAAGSALAMGPENVAVLVNRYDSESLTVANYYRVKRKIPDANFIYLTIPANRKETTWDNFARSTYYPMIATIERRGLKRQIAVIVTTPGFPYRVGQNGLSGVLFFGNEQKTVSTFGPANFLSANGYVDRCEPFMPSADGQPRAFLHMHMDAGNLGATMAMIDRSVLADNSKPKGTVYLLDGEGPRAARKDSIPLAGRLLDSLGVKNIESNAAYLRGKTDVLGMFTGVAKFPVSENRYVKGALGDLLTSVSGQLLDTHTQTRSWEWLAAGCSATYGAVVEPYNYPQKFPSAKLHAYYAMGFTAAEAYWMSVLWPQQGLFLGDPLTRPFGDPPKIETSGLVAEQSFRDSIKFFVVASAKGDAPGVSVVEMYLDDKPIGQFRRTELKEQISLRLKVDDFLLEDKLPANGKLAELLAGWQNKFIARGIEAIVAPGMLLLFIPANPAKPPVVEASSSHPFVYVKAQPISQPRGQATPATAQWLIEGSPEIGDKLVLEVLELPNASKRFEFPIAVPMSAAELALRMTAEVAPNLPKAYRFDGEMASLAGHRIGRMSLKATSAQVLANPRARLSIVRTPNSTLKITPADSMIPLVDASLNSYAMAMVRFGWGEDRIQVNADFPTKEMDDGRHVLRFVAKRGWPSQPDSRLIVPFVVRKSEQRLVLKSLAPPGTSLTLSERQTPALMARAEYPGDKPLAFEFQVNGQPVSASDRGKPNEFYFDPKRHGIGLHQVTVVGSSAAGKNIRGDNALIVEVLP